MSYKHHRGRWAEVAPLVNAFEGIVLAEGFALLPLSAAHATLAGAFPAKHRDPFDRLLAAQATVEGLTFLSKDKGLRVLGVIRFPVDPFGIPETDTLQGRAGPDTLSELIKRKAYWTA